MIIDLDSLTEVEDDSLFTLERALDFPYERDYNAQFNMVIEMHKDKIAYKRQGYHILDLASDIGGLQSLLFSAFAFLVGIWNYNMFDNYLVSRLYKLEHPD